jgi:hypothetical protein
MSRPRFAGRIIIPQPYTPALKTDIRRAFRAERERLAAEKRRRAADAAEAAEKTVILPRKRA